MMPKIVKPVGIAVLLLILLINFMNFMVKWEKNLKITSKEGLEP